VQSKHFRAVNTTVQLLHVCFGSIGGEILKEEHQHSHFIGTIVAYTLHFLEDIVQVNVPTELEGGQLLTEKVDRRKFIYLLQRMLPMDQERRKTPGEALQHQFFYRISSR
jgi:hypothetical protein